MTQQDVSSSWQEEKGHNRNHPAVAKGERVDAGGDNEDGGWSLSGRICMPVRFSDGVCTQRLPGLNTTTKINHL